VTCRSTPNAACVQSEVDAAAAIRAVASREPAGKTAPSVRVCEAALSRGSDSFVQQKRCVDAVGDRHPSEQIIRHCLRSFEWHTQTDGQTTGMAIAKCFDDSR
jgi:hypothetical protein